MATATVPIIRESRWPRFAARRLAGLAAVLAAAVVGTFAILQLVPGDPARVVAGPDATPGQVAAVRHRLGLDQSAWSQFTAYVSHLLHGDLGTSYAFQGRSVSGLIGQRLPFTAELAFGGLAVALLVGVPLGLGVAVLCRGGRRRWLDGAFTAVSAIGGAVPEYVLATLLIVVLANGLKLFPPGGAATPSSLVLPVLAVAIGPICALGRIVRRESAVVLGHDFMRTARGRRLGPARLYLRHALPNLLTSTLTVGGLILVSLLGGTVLVETAFGWPGLGTAVVQGILNRDYPLIQGVVLVLALLATSVTILIDVLLALLDPRSLSEAEAAA